MSVVAKLQFYFYLSCYITRHLFSFVASSTYIHVRSSFGVLLLCSFSLSVSDFVENKHAHSGYRPRVFQVNLHTHSYTHTHTQIRDINLRTVFRSLRAQLPFFDAYWVSSLVFVCFYIRTFQWSSLDINTFFLMVKAAVAFPKKCSILKFWFKDSAYNFQCISFFILFPKLRSFDFKIFNHFWIVPVKMKQNKKNM